MADKDNSSPFSIHLEGEDTGNMWVGDFRAKHRLSLRDQLRRDQVRRELEGSMGGTPDGRASSIAIIMGELAVRLIDTPKWWNEIGGGLDLEDGNILAAIYDAAIKIEKEAREARVKKGEEAQKDLKKLAEEQKDV